MGSGPRQLAKHMQRMRSTDRDLPGGGCGQGQSRGCVVWPLGHLWMT